MLGGLAQAGGARYLEEKFDKRVSKRVEENLEREDSAVGGCVGYGESLCRFWLEATGSGCECFSCGRGEWMRAFLRVARGVHVDDFVSHVLVVEMKFPCMFAYELDITCIIKKT